MGTSNLHREVKCHKLYNKPAQIIVSSTNSNPCKPSLQSIFIEKWYWKTNSKIDDKRICTAEPHYLKVRSLNKWIIVPLVPKVGLNYKSLHMVQKGHGRFF
jgi:hypothetical protein